MTMPNLPAGLVRNDAFDGVRKAVVIVEQNYGLFDKWVREAMVIE